MLDYHRGDPIALLGLAQTGHAVAVLPLAALLQDFDALDGVEGNLVQVDEGPLAVVGEQHVVDEVEGISTGAAGLGGDAAPAFGGGLGALEMIEDGQKAADDVFTDADLDPLLLFFLAAPKVMKLGVGPLDLLGKLFIRLLQDL